jgi:hypothetical protein
MSDSKPAAVMNCPTPLRDHEALLAHAAGSLLGTTGGEAMDDECCPAMVVPRLPLRVSSGVLLALRKGG